MKYKQILIDPLLYAVIALNIYLIYEYQQNPDSIHSIIALYWVQSVLIGLFNFIDILTVQKVKPGSFSINEKKASRGCAALFFLVHYGFFHFGYFLFLAFSSIDTKKINWHFMQLAFWILLAGMTINFIQNKIRFRDVEMNIGSMFFLPYLRIVPMHLMILIPAFIHVSSFLIFLILKSIFDVLMHILYNKILYKPVLA